MDQEKDTNSVEPLAEEAIGKFEAISNAASTQLSTATNVSRETLAYPNASNAHDVLKNLEKSARAVGESNRHLTREPAIARVVVLDSNKKKRTYYICRAAPVSGVPNLASYRAAIGRLASLPIGESIIAPNGEELEVVEQARFRPFCDSVGWDSNSTVIETEGFGPATIRSLREFLKSVSDARNVDDILEKIQAEETLGESILSGIRRSVITKMALRDQPILDKLQDEVFRLPLDSQLFLFGPPGTGKTTTLIRRLGQKLNVSFLNEDERALIETSRVTRDLVHDVSWRMFTPTDLLRLYLKEAFQREGIPAPDDRVQTWGDFRRHVSRNVFGILRNASGNGLYICRDEVEYLKSGIEAQSIQWYEDYFDWQRSDFQREMREAARTLSESDMDGARALGARLTEILDSRGWMALTAEAPRAQALVSGIKGSCDDLIRGALKEQLKADPKFLDELALFLDSLSVSNATEADERDEVEEPDDEESVAHTPKSKAIHAYMAALRTHARSVAAGRSIAKTARNGKIIEWIGVRSLDEKRLLALGKSLICQSNARRFADPVRRSIEGVGRRYRSFRTLRLSEGKWYRGKGIDSRDIHPLELDLILLAILRSAAEFLHRQRIVNAIDDPIWSSLRPALEVCRNQIVVDEATDFSPVQLACMSALAHPFTRSFFACGDFNQRLTTWGTRSREEMEWAVRGVEFREINVAYRQTRELVSLARDIVVAVGGSNPIVELPPNVDNNGVEPALLEHAADEGLLVGWLAERLREIEHFVGQAPSVAIFVGSEAEVAPLADALDRLLVEDNFRVVACPRGQVMGQDNDVRVFDIQHIKGLEFEAVFFVGIDQVAVRQPTLFDKYLYVGATRAATYLGLTCRDELPEPIRSLRSRFVADWKTPSAGFGVRQ
jgi:UvrD-like helicase C-terminal domain